MGAGTLRASRGVSLVNGHLCLPIRDASGFEVTRGDFTREPILTLRGDGVSILALLRPEVARDLYAQLGALLAAEPTKEAA